jgi:hypothetical protein
VAVLKIARRGKINVVYFESEPVSTVLATVQEHEKREMAKPNQEKDSCFRE